MRSMNRYVIDCNILILQKKTKKTHSFEVLTVFENSDKMHKITFLGE